MAPTRAGSTSGKDMTMRASWAQSRKMSRNSRRLGSGSSRPRMIWPRWVLPLTPPAILREPALPPAIERGDGHALADIGQFLAPLPAVPGVAVKFYHGRPAAGGGARRTYLAWIRAPRTPVKKRSKHSAVRSRAPGWAAVRLRIDQGHLGQRRLPVSVKIGRPRIAAGCSSGVQRRGFSKTAMVGQMVF